MDFKNFKFSKSSVLTLLNCPQSFKLQYIAKKQSKPNKYALKGIKLHKLLEKLNKNEICLSDVYEQDKVHLNNYIEFLKLYKLDLPQYSEYKEFDFEIDGLKFGGGVDALFIKDNRGFVLDYKTGKEKYTLNDNRFELQLYSYMCEKKFNIDVIKYGILYTVDGMFLGEKNDHRYDEIHIKINKVKQVISENNFRHDYGVKCNLCNFKLFCEEYKHKNNII